MTNRNTAITGPSQRHGKYAPKIFGEVRPCAFSVLRERTDRQTEKKQSYSSQYFVSVPGRSSKSQLTQTDPRNVLRHAHRAVHKSERST